MENKESNNMEMNYDYYHFGQIKGESISTNYTIIDTSANSKLKICADNNKKQKDY